ncbi:SufD family Fe-S cluster assembly protein [Ureaplasma ceti]|uniref:SUF system FeS cluster assembly SufBD core domain-containing protein n=1 Tax=Ureaplasma ceti TaxID=3119530 RepID=A0ABP9U794_9BACT
MENKDFLYITQDREYKFSVAANDNISRNFLVIANEDTSVDLNFRLDTNATATTYVLVLANQSAKVEINVNSYSNVDLAKFFAKVVVLGVQKSETHVRITSTVDSMTKNNRVDQDICGVIMSKKAKILGEPVLVINTEDIMAKHALNIGALNNEELFYLQSKGIPEVEAQKMIVSGLINQALVDLSEEEQAVYKKQINEILEADNA